MELRTNLFMKSKRGFLFTLDAFFASIILVGGLLLISQHLLTEAPKEHLEYLSTDVLSSLAELKMSDIYIMNNSFVTYLINSDHTNNTNMNLSVLEQIGTYWATNAMNASNVSLAIILSDHVLNEILPKNIGLNLTIQGLSAGYYSDQSDSLFSKFESRPSNLVVGERMITGINKGSPLSGSTSSAYLRRIINKTTSSFAYFGGFVGQGNITVFLDNIPSDVSAEDVTRMVLEMDVGGNFTLRINGTDCTTRSPTATNMSPDQWDVSNCSAFIHSGRNNISLIFHAPINQSYVAGGFLRVDYKTDELQQNFSAGTKRYYFPGIEGIINLYDSIYAPGVINGWLINISFFNNYTTYLVIGNGTIFYAEGKNDTQNLTYSRTGLNIIPTTIPIRLGTMNFSNVTQVITGEAGDTVLVTDISSSMADCAERTTQLMCGYYCLWIFWRECPSLHCNDLECGGGFLCMPSGRTQFYACNRTKMDIAKSADKLAVDIILNSSANRMGLVSYSTNANADVGPPLTNNKAVLKSAIDSYSASGYTCICCGINRAKDMLLSSSNKKFMIVLSDGDANLYCNGYSDYVGRGDMDYTNGRSWAIAAGREACRNNITVFSIGFGTNMSAEGQDAMKNISCNSSLYFNATNVSMLSQIYRNISEMIVSYANYTSQTVTVVGNVTYSRLSPNSYIDLYYTPIIEAPVPNEISIELQTKQFNNCTANISIPSGIRVMDAKITSYSAEHWTRTLVANSLTVYNLSQYGQDYKSLGDPYLIQIPSVILQNGTNMIYIDTGDNATDSTGCSKNNTLIYTALVPSSTARSGVVEKTEGCEWTIQFEDDTNSTKSIPGDYSGSKKCSYTAANHTLANGSYDDEDAYDIAVYSLLRDLDFDYNGKIFVDLDAADIEIVITTVSSVPYLWGPTIVKAEVWQ